MSKAKRPVKKLSYAVFSAGSNTGKTFLKNQLAAFIDNPVNIYIENQDRQTLNVSGENVHRFEYNQMTDALKLFKRSARRESVLLDVGNEGVIDLYNNASSDATLSKSNVITILVVSAKNLDRLSDTVELAQYLLDEAGVLPDNIRVVFNFVPQKYRKNMTLLFAKLISELESLGLEINEKAILTDNDAFSVMDKIGTPINGFVYLDGSEDSGTSAFARDQIEGLYDDDSDEADTLLDMFDIANTPLNKGDLLNTMQYILGDSDEG